MNLEQIKQLEGTLEKEQLWIETQKRIVEAKRELIAKLYKTKVSERLNLYKEWKKERSRIYASN